MARAPIEMTMEELLRLPVTVSLVTAGRAFGLGRELSYELAQRDEFPCPVRRLGQRLRITKADLFVALGLRLDGTPMGAPEADDDPGTAA